MGIFNIAHLSDGVKPFSHLGKVAAPALALTEGEGARNGLNDGVGLLDPLVGAYFKLGSIGQFLEIPCKFYP